MASGPVCSAPALASGWSVVTPVSVIGTTLVIRFVALSKIALIVDGVNVTGTPSSEPESLVAYSVTPPLKASVGLEVTVVPPPCVTASVTPPASVIESAMNFIIVTVPPLATGISTLP